jgi:L-asparagine oxygenase
MAMSLFEFKPVIAPPVLRVAGPIRDQWTRAALALHYPDYRNLHAWNAFRRASVKLASEYLATVITDELHRFFSPIGAEFLVIENLPVDPNLPSIPTDGMRPAGKQAVSEAVICGLVSPWAEILSFTHEKNGSPIHEVVPVPGMEMVQSNSGRVPMGFHSDNAFLSRRFRQQGLLLFGLRNEDTATLVITAEQIANAASPALIDALMRPAFRHVCPASFQLPGEPMVSEPRAILDSDELGHVRVKAASSRIEPMDADAALALQAFRALCEKLEPHRIVVRPGTALLFKDDRVLHGRDTVGGQRWLQRVYFRESLDPLRKATASDPDAFAFDARLLTAA